MSPKSGSDAAEKGRYKISRALVELTCSHVFHASIIMRLRRVEADIPFPMGTDGTSLLVNPELCAQFDVPALTSILAHEAMHVAGRHTFRQGARLEMVVGPVPPKGELVPVSLWNLAADEVVNDAVNASGLKMPDGCVPGVPDTTPEKQYELKKQWAAKLPKMSVSGGSGKAGKGDVPMSVDGLYQPRNPDGTPMNKAQRQEAEQEAKQWVEAAANAAKRAGQMNAGLERFVKRELRSVVHWREVLARFVSEKCITDYSWQRPNQRYTGFGMYLPRLETKDIPNVAVACDTSGSISPKMIEEVVAEVIAVLSLMAEGATVEVPVLWFDHDVYPQIVSDADELKVRGGGGTAYSPVMKWVRKNHAAHDFKGLVVVTDGYCSDFGEAPPCDVLWVLTHDHDESFRPPYGEVALVLEEHR